MATVQCLMVQVFRLGKSMDHWLRREGIFYRLSFLRQATEAYSSTSTPTSPNLQTDTPAAKDLSKYKVTDTRRETHILSQIQAYSSFVINRWNSLGGSKNMHAVNIKLRRLAEKMAAMRAQSCLQPEEEILLDFDDVGTAPSQLNLNANPDCNSAADTNVNTTAPQTLSKKGSASRRPPKKRRRRSSSAMELVSMELRSKDKRRPQEWTEAFIAFKKHLQSEEGVAANELMESGLLAELKACLSHPHSEAYAAFIQCFDPASLKALLDLVSALLYRADKLDVVHYGPKDEPAQVERLSIPVSVTLKPSPLCKGALGTWGDVGELKLKVEPLATLRDVASTGWELMKETIEQGEARMMHKLYTRTKPHGSLPQVGTKVQRGKHWRWGSQDEGSEGLGGTVVEVVSWRKGHVEGGQGVRVVWSATNRCYTYRYGAEGAFDVQVYKPHSRREISSAAMTMMTDDMKTKMPKVKQVWRDNISANTQVDILTAEFLWKPAVVKRTRRIANDMRIILVKDQWIISTSRRIVPRGQRCPFFLDNRDLQGPAVFSEDIAVLEQALRLDPSADLITAWTMSLQSGDKVEVNDEHAGWTEAVVLRVMEHRLLVHLVGFPAFKNRWLSADDSSEVKLLAPMYTNIQSGVEEDREDEGDAVPRNIEELKALLFQEADLVIIKSASRRATSRRIAAGTEAYICIKVLSRFLWVKVRVEGSQSNEKTDCTCVSYNDGSIFRDKIPRNEIATVLPKKHEFLSDAALQALMKKHDLTLEGLAEDHGKDVDTEDDAAEDEEDEENRDEEAFKSSAQMDAMYDEDEEFEDLSGPLQRAVSLALTRFQDAQNRAEDAMDAGSHMDADDASYRDRDLDSPSERRGSRGSNFVSRGSATRRSVSSSTDGLNLRNLGSRLAVALTQSHSSSSLASLPDLGRLYAREALSMIQGQGRSGEGGSSQSSASGRRWSVPLQVACNDVGFPESCTILEVVQKVRRWRDTEEAERNGSMTAGLDRETWYEHVWQHTHALDVVVNEEEQSWVEFRKKMVEVGQITAVNGAVAQVDRGICEVKTHFPTIAPKGVWLKRGHWYYEVEVVNAGLAQIGWADPYFSPQDQKGLGCGDDIHSWAFDGLRIKRWNETSTVWGRRWKAGDVVGCAVSIDAEASTLCIRYSINGLWEPPMGIAFEATTFQGTAVRPVITFNSSFRCRVLLGEKGESSTDRLPHQAELLPMKFDPPAPHFQRLSKFIHRENAKTTSSSSSSSSSSHGLSASANRGAGAPPLLKDMDSRLIDQLDSSFLMLLDVLNAVATAAPNLNIQRFFSPRLSQHLVRQLKDPVALCSGSLPEWCWKIPHEYKQLFPFKVRLRFFELTAFGCSQTVQRLRQGLEDTSNDR